MLRGGEAAGEAVGPLQEAARLLNEVGELDLFARLQLSRAALAEEIFPLSTALNTYEDASALYRKLGDRAGAPLPGRASS
jgi:hypothetical protein